MSKMHVLRRWLSPVKTLPPDDFVRRLRSLVIGEGMLHDGNIYLMDYAIRHLPPTGHVLEIGSYGGLSTNLLRYLLTKHGQANRLLFNCDAWTYEGYHDHLGHPPGHIDGRPDVLRADYGAYLKQAFLNATRFLSAAHLPHTVHAWSDDFFEKWAAAAVVTDEFGRTVTLGGPLALAYIDGGHSEEQAWRDVENAARWLVKDGFLLLDDSADHLSFGSARMMPQLLRDGRWKLVAKNPNYLIQKV
jgi:hypothetical protein